MQDTIYDRIPFDPFRRLLSGLVARRFEYGVDYRRIALKSLGMKVE